MSDASSEPKAWFKVIAGIAIRVVIYPAVFMLLYALSQGPAAYYHNRSVRGGGAGYPRLMTIVYAPAHRVEHLLPFYHDYMRWWLGPD